MEIETLLKKIAAGDAVALSRAISIVENNRPQSAKILSTAFHSPQKALKIGVTGAPGSGKSSVIARLSVHLRRLNKKVAVLAVDPSSPLTGGAILGDRVRMSSLAADNQVFIRSLASRGHLGGISSATAKILPLFDLAGKDIVLIETVGVGQSETEIMEIADLTVLILNPQSGDEIQILKAGIMEIADIYLVNKSDLEGADFQLQELQAYFSLSGISPPALMVSAKHDNGFNELVKVIFQQAEILRERNRKKNFANQRQLLKKIILEKTEDWIERHPLWINFNAEKSDPFCTADEIFRRMFDDKKN